MLVQITRAINLLITGYLTTADLQKYSSTSHLLRSFAIEELIRREAPKYEKSNLTNQEVLLFIAVRYGFIDLVKKVIDERVDVNARLQINQDNFATPIEHAALGGSLDCVKLLIKHGAVFTSEVSARYHTSPLHYAALGGSVDCLAYFLDEGITVDQESSVGCPFGWCWTALQIASSHGWSACVTLLLARGANVHHQDGSWFQAIHRAAHIGNAEVVRILAAAGADVNASNEDGIKPLDLAVNRTDSAAEETIIELLKNNADSRHASFPFYLMPLQICIFKKNLLSAAALLKHDPTLINARYEIDGKLLPLKYADLTALHIAAEQDYEDGVVFLLEHGANVKLKSCSGYRAIDLVKDKNGSIARILRENRMLYHLRKRIRRNLKNEEHDPNIAPPNIIEEAQIKLPVQSAENKSSEIKEEAQEINRSGTCCRIS